jgi:hypothetical protein
VGLQAVPGKILFFAIASLAPFSTMKAAIVMCSLLVSSAEFIQTPGGLVDSSCIHEVKNGATHDGAITCDIVAPVPNKQIYSMDVHAQSSNTSGFTSFTADFIVPQLPATKGRQIVYFWPGFKSQQPEMGLPVLQPVLQYGQHGAEWQLQSWFVHGGAVTAPAISVSPGDKITSFMKYDTTTETWTISGINTATQKSSVLKISKKKLGGYSFDWAMLVCETIKEDGKCDLLPADPAGLTFTNVTVDDKPITWTVRENLDDCKEDVETDTAGDTVKMTWSYTK